MKRAKWTALDKIGGVVVCGGLLVVSVIGALWGWRALWPASRWYELRAVRVSDAAFTAPVTMAVDRVIHRDFQGEYLATVRRASDMQPVCNGGEEVPYRTSSTLPDPLTLDWWTYGAVPPCMTVLAPGDYILTSCISVHTGIPLVGTVRECLDSNIFKVTE